MEYAFECRKCGEQFRLRESLAEHEKHHEKCPKCGSSRVVQRLEPAFVVTSRKS